MKPTPLHEWMRQATTAQQEELARRAGTTRAYLYQLSAGQAKAYSREPTPAKAIAIEKAADKMAKRYGLPRVLRTDLVAACRTCEFARHCLTLNAPQTIQMHKIK